MKTVKPKISISCSMFLDINTRHSTYDVLTLTRFYKPTKYVMKYDV